MKKVENIIGFVVIFIFVIILALLSISNFNISFDVICLLMFLVGSIIVLEMFIFSTKKMKK